MGHSAGGKLSFYAAALDSRIDLVVAWDPQNGGGPPCFLGMIGGGSCNDFPVAPNCEADSSGLLHQIRERVYGFRRRGRPGHPRCAFESRAIYRGAPSPTHFVSMPAVGHAAWTRAGDVSTLTRGIHTALFLNRLTGMTDLDEWLPGVRDSSTPQKLIAYARK